MKHLKQGDKAPNFEGKDQNGNSIKLSDFKGHKLVLYFYPKDNTPTCTVEACNLRDNHELLLSKGYKVVGVSPDSVKKHSNFVKKFDLPFPLLSDPELKAIEAYGVWGPKKFMGKEYIGLHRTTFIISEDGVIEEIIEKVKSKEHTDQILTVNVDK